MGHQSVPATATRVQPGDNENQIVRDSYLYLHWNGILTHDKAETEMATFASAALLEPDHKWKRKFGLAR
ncbi:hypothetical protein [Martelella mediterranea]|uniref:Uncharacterized protein n=1 Tax=Martelella mediterranea TaxID=293089 RepID=A0A4R3P289_9HYPH|nr:hypothetical protein [Martelella mediterranea]TCT44668.1 hypothetical protein EDC90_1002218 [Martelella mediterranea]